MFIKELQLINFRGFKKITVSFSAHFSLIVGNNGSGKSSNTEGVVLIDELDLHLHPDWQKKLVKALRTVFPKIQFIASSHSPFLIQEMSDGELIRLQNEEILIGGGALMSIEDIAEQIQDIENPQWSDKRKALFENASEYFKMLKANGSVSEKERRIKEATMFENMKYFSSNPAHDAFMEQFKILNEK